MTLRYAVLARREWDNHTERLQDCPGVHIVGAENLRDLVQARTGRAVVLNYPSVARKLRNGQRVYVAPAGRSEFGPNVPMGILVQKVS